MFANRKAAKDSSTVSHSSPTSKGWLYGDHGNSVRGGSPDCRSESFRPFSCKVFNLCPSCSQKRTLLFGEHVNERLLRRLPHRQLVFTFPKVLRGFFRHGRGLCCEASKRV
jgi:hypothetical protein